MLTLNAKPSIYITFRGFSYQIDIHIIITLKETCEEWMKVVFNVTKVDHCCPGLCSILTILDMAVHLTQLVNSNRTPAVCNLELHDINAADELSTLGHVWLTEIPLQWQQSFCRPIHRRFSACRGQHYTHHHCLRACNIWWMLRDTVYYDFRIILDPTDRRWRIYSPGKGPLGSPLFLRISAPLLLWAFRSPNPAVCPHWVPLIRVISRHFSFDKIIFSSRTEIASLILDVSNRKLSAAIQIGAQRVQILLGRSPGKG